MRARVVRDHQRNGLQSIPARDRARDEAGHDVPALALRVSQIRQRVARDAARGEDQRRFLRLGERDGLMTAFVSQRPGGNLHAEAEAARPPFPQCVQ